ncbi:diguanylate cyclase [Alteromonas genovensis]|uniref:diguanylate cyclase n=1 Tax=Alteromonas genovensis TaxID=471225 RepID=UPI002FE2B56D
MNKKIAHSSLNEGIEISNPSRYMTITYTVSLSFIAVLSLLVHLMLDKVISEQDESGHFINVSGQQRMLSQRASLFTLDYIYSGNKESRELATESLKKLKDNHAFLLNAHYESLASTNNSVLSDEMLSLYFDEPFRVSQKVATFESMVNNALINRENYSKAGAVEPEFVGLAKDSLLAGFNAVVYQYEREGNQQVARLRTVQSVVLVIVVLTLIVEAFFIFRPMVNKVSTYASKLQKEANYDALSGLLNRRAFNAIAQQFFMASRRYKAPLSVIMLDIDFFKRINDTYGHDTGDLAIKWISNMLTDSMRESDCVARIGGEEFVVLLPNTENRGALQTAEKIRSSVASSIFEIKGNEIPITISLGVSSADEEDHHVEAVIKRADTALYESKSSGRNKVSLFAH